MNGYGYTEINVSVPDSGLYYMWLYFSGNNLKNVYGYILVDNLGPDIALEGISLPKTQTIILGKTLTLTPTFNSTNATNKIVTWSSSDESVATISNAGLITAKKMGSTIITVVSQDGNKKATCTVTITEETPNNTNEEGKTTDNSKTDTPTPSTTPATDTKTTTTAKDDTTMATGKLPQTGVGLGLTTTIIAFLAIAGFTFIKCRKFRDI